jgi:hypothetical protein
MYPAAHTCMHIANLIKKACALIIHELAVPLGLHLVNIIDTFIFVLQDVLLSEDWPAIF